MKFDYKCKMAYNKEKPRLILNWLIALLFFWVFMCGLSCRKLVEVNAPITSLNSANVYSTDATAISAVTAIYSSTSGLGTPFNAQLTSMSGLAGLSADEFVLYSGASDQALKLYYSNALSNNNNGKDFWPNIYSLLFKINSAIEGLGNSSSLTPAIKRQLIGEAKFSRAFCYFYLVNLYGDVPLILTTDYSVNATFSRTPKDQVWQQVIQDLREAQAMLSPNYLDATILASSSERTRPTKWAASALLARVYLYNKNWAGADSAASAVIKNSSQYSLNSLDSVFLKNSNEAIWQLQTVLSSYNTQDAYYFILPLSGPNSDTRMVYLNNTFVNAINPIDLRKTHWINSVTVSGVTYYYPFKYKNNTLNSQVTEYTMVLRLGEQYLIRSEAKARLNDLPNAIADLNIIRNRAGLTSTNAATQDDLIAAILDERRIELLTEWGHRWLDLKRTGTVDAVMGIGGACAAKGGTWKTEWQLYPIPLTELQADPHLVQNPGYN